MEKIKHAGTVFYRQFLLHHKQTCKKYGAWNSHTHMPRGASCIQLWSDWFKKHPVCLLFLRTKTCQCLRQAYSYESHLPFCLMGGKKGKVIPKFYFCVSVHRSIGQIKHQLDGTLCRFYFCSHSTCYGRQAPIIRSIKKLARWSLVQVL